MATLSQNKMASKTVDEEMRGSIQGDQNGDKMHVIRGDFFSRKNSLFGNKNGDFSIFRLLNCHFLIRDIFAINWFLHFLKYKLLQNCQCLQSFGILLPLKNSIFCLSTILKIFLIQFLKIPFFCYFEGFFDKATFFIKKYCLKGLFSLKHWRLF
jgi:hypothetical protein